MKPLLLFVIPILFSCKNSTSLNRPSSVVKTVKHYPSDSTIVEEITLLDTASKKSQSVFYNGFGDTDRIEYSKGGQLDSVQFYTYECDHWPDTVVSVHDIPNITHNTKHPQFLTYTEVFGPTEAKRIYDTIHYLEDSIFYANKDNADKSQSEELNRRLLKGKWVSEDDKRYKLVFTDTVKQDFYSGKLENSFRYWTKSDALVARDINTGEIFNYSIINLSEDHLVLMYERGNLLKFLKHQELNKTKKSG